MRRGRSQLFLAVVIAAAVGGCGSSGDVRHAVGRSAGRALFASACSACHSLSGHESPRRQGGDLLRLRVSRAAMLEFVAEMPVRHRLTPRQVSTVSDYVLAVEAQRG